MTPGIPDANELDCGAGLEVFRLVHGLDTRPLLRGATWTDFLSKGPRWSPASGPVRLQAIQVP
jgi:hypothetical protein